MPRHCAENFAGKKDRDDVAHDDEKEKFRRLFAAAIGARVAHPSNTLPVSPLVQTVSSNVPKGARNRGIKRDVLQWEPSHWTDDLACVHKRFCGVPATSTPYDFERAKSFSDNLAQQRQKSTNVCVEGQALVARPFVSRRVEGAHMHRWCASLILCLTYIRCT